jgi:hypothetical protein
MKLDSREPKVSGLLHLYPVKWSKKPDSCTAQPEGQTSTWVQLRERPSPYSHDEALLLCQHSETEWIVWIPEYGEMILHQSQIGETCY